MADLVRILSRPVGAEVNSVDARELHQALGVGKVFAAWIRERIDLLGFTQGVDFEVLSETGNNPLGGRPSIEYVVTLDAAKHLAMIERNEKGREIRAYFIEAEKKLRAVDPMVILSDPAALRGLLGSYAERVQALEATVAEQAPKVEFVDRVFDCGDTLGFRQAAQQIKAATGANENEFRALIFTRGWAQRLGGDLAPAHAGIERGYVTTREEEVTRRDGSKIVKPIFRVTQKGLAKAIELLLASEAAE